MGGTVKTTVFDEIATGTFSGGTPLPVAAIIWSKDLVSAGALETAHVPTLAQLGALIADREAEGFRLAPGAARPTQSASAPPARAPATVLRAEAVVR